MIKDNLGVRVMYRDKDLKPVYTKKYTLDGYTAMLRDDLQALVTDLENLCYGASGGKSKSEWDDRLWVGFNQIKHK